MRLIVCWNERINIDVNDSDILLTNNHILYNKLHKKVETILFDQSVSDEDSDLRDNINLLFKSLPPNISVLRNVFFSRLFRPMYSIITQIENLIESYLIDEIVLIGGGSTDIFLTLNKGEGEGKKFFYKTSWLLNPIIYAYFFNKIKITNYRQINNSVLKVFNYLREKLLILLWLIKFSLTIVKQKKVINEFYGVDQLMLAVVHTPLQFKYVEDVLKKIRIPLYYLTSSSAVIHQKNDNIIKYNQYSIKALFRSLKLYTKVRNQIRKRNKLEFQIKGTNIQLNNKTFIHCLKLQFLRYQIQRIQIEEMIGTIGANKIISLVTAMTYNEKIVLVNDLAKQLGIRHINFQPATMNRILFPQMNLADIYFLYSPKTLDLYRRYSSSYRFYLPINNVEEPRSVLNTLTIFTQPDTYTFRYLSFLEQFLPQIKNLLPHFKVKIKLHYRQNHIHKFHDILATHPEVEIMNGNLHAKEAILDSTFILSMTSTVLFESVMLNTPGIILSLTEADEKLIHKNDACCPEVNFFARSCEEVIRVLTDTNKNIEIYKTRRSEWLSSLSKIDLEDAIGH